MRTWLVLDCHFLCHRAFHTMGALSFGDIKTGVVYGFLKDIVALKDDFGSDNIVFCFESAKNKRKDLFPEYKKKRHAKEYTEEELMVLGEFHAQIRKLKEEYLARIGFQNIFWQKGYESDDVIASITQALPEEQEAVIVSADKDLFQLLRPNVVMHNPSTRKTTTIQSFYRDTGLRPKQYARVLALAGCKTDEVPGIPGVGQKTAIKYLLGNLKETSKAFKAIESDAGRKIVQRNKPLVKLPFEGVGTFDLTRDKVQSSGWNDVCTELGMKSIRGAAPLSGRETRKDKGFGL